MIGLSAPILADDLDHEHPDDIDGDSDLEAVEHWLSDRMGEIHADCADGIEIGAFDACEDLDEEYTDLLDQYATVEDDLYSETETAEQLNDTREQQQRYAELREEFDATFDEYEAARAAGNDTEARALARELQQLADQIETLGGEIEANFIELDAGTTADLSTSKSLINESTNETRTVRVAVESESFEETNTTAATANQSASFAEPAVVSGQVTALNGTEISNGTVVLTDGTQSFTTTTTANGTYELQYRPAATPVGETNLTVAYQPATGDPYLSSNTTTSVVVHSTPSSLDIATSSNQVAFNESLTITGEVRAADRPASDVNVTLHANTTPLTTSQTDSDGNFRAETPVPVTMATGTHTIAVQASASNRSLQPSQETVELTVEETSTELQATATETDGTLNISGRLTADVEASVGSRPVSI